jgi:hypothetical protein
LMTSAPVPQPTPPVLSIIPPNTLNVNASSITETTPLQNPITTEIIHVAPPPSPVS